MHTAYEILCPLNETVYSLCCSLNTFNTCIDIKSHYFFSSFCICEGSSGIKVSVALGQTSQRKNKQTKQRRYHNLLTS